MARVKAQKSAVTDGFDFFKLLYLIGFFSLLMSIAFVGNGVKNLIEHSALLAGTALDFNVLGAALSENLIYFQIALGAFIGCALFALASAQAPAKKPYKYLYLMAFFCLLMTVTFVGNGILSVYHAAEFIAYTTLDTGVLHQALAGSLLYFQISAVFFVSCAFFSVVSLMGQELKNRKLSKLKAKKSATKKQAPAKRKKA